VLGRVALRLAVGRAGPDDRWPGTPGPRRTAGMAQRAELVVIEPVESVARELPHQRFRPSLGPSDAPVRRVVRDLGAPAQEAIDERADCFDLVGPAFGPGLIELGGGRSQVVGHRDASHRFLGEPLVVDKRVPRKTTASMTVHQHTRISREPRRRGAPARPPRACICPVGSQVTASKGSRLATKTGSSSIERWHPKGRGARHGRAPEVEGGTGVGAVMQLPSEGRP